MNPPSRVCFKLILMGCLALPLSACVSHSTPGSSSSQPAASPVALSPETDRFLLELSKIKQDSRDKVVLPYTAAANIGSQNFSPKVAPAERKKKADQVLNLLKQPMADLTILQGRLSKLDCPSQCGAVKKHFQGYLEALGRELECTRQYSELFTRENPGDDSRLSALSDKLTRAAQDRSDENGSFQYEIRKLTSSAPAPKE